MPKKTKINGGKFQLPWKGSYKTYKTFDNNVIELTTLNDDEVERVNINKLKEYHSKSVITSIIANNVYVEKYPNKYHQNKPQFTRPKLSLQLVFQPRRLPWINSKTLRLYMMHIFGYKKRNQKVINEET